MSDRFSGKASYFTFNNYNIPITKATHKATAKLGDATDNGDYDLQSDLIYPVQLRINVVTEFAIEGRFRKSVIPGYILAVFYQSNPGGLMAYLGYDATSVAGHGYFDMSDFQTEVPTDDTVTYTCNFKSNGKFTPLS